jgi:hypothetical protein
MTRGEQGGTRMTMPEAPELTRPSEAARRRARRGPRLPSLREHRWSATDRALVVCVLAIAMGVLFLASYSLLLGDPVPHRIDAALVGDPTTNAATVDTMQSVAKDSLVFRQYASLPAALHAMDEQSAYATLDVASATPTLYVSSAAGASVARVLEQISAVDPAVLVVDTHPLGPADPNGLETFYLMLVPTIIGFITVFQVRSHAAGLSLRRWTAIIVGLDIVASLVFTLVDGPVLHRLALPVAETWGILALQLVAVSAFASLMQVLIGRWALLPTWTFFTILGNSASGGAVAPALLPQPFAFVSQWLPSGATVDALREAVYFPAYQHLHPIVVLAAWAAALLGTMLVVSRWRRKSPGVA